MAEPGGPPGFADLARRWAARLAEAHGVTADADKLEPTLRDFANEVLASTETAAASSASSERFTALYSASPSGIALADNDGTIVEANPALGRILGCDPAELRGTAIAELGTTDNQGTKLQVGLDDLPETGTVHYRESLLIGRTEAEPLWARVTLTQLPGDRAGSWYPVLMVEDANELHLLQETLRHQTLHDPLTGLPNASRFSSKLEAMLAAEHGDQIALVYLDLDGFKVINDGLGAGVADRVLREAARTLSSVFTEHDGFVARLSGDGFAVLLRGDLVATDVIALVERALEDLAEPVYLDGGGVGVSASAGIVVRGATDGPQSELLRAAEIALHRAKEAGKAQWMLFDPELDARDRSRYHLGAVLAGALEMGEFFLTYQPTAFLAHMEKLAAVNVDLRWNHPELGELSFGEFYPLAETTGLATHLGRWMLNASVAAAAHWRTSFGLNAPEICLRLPDRLARDPDLVRMVKEELDRNELPAHALRLRTERSLLLDPQGEVLDSLSVLADLGAQIALTVVGTADLELVGTVDLPIKHVILGGWIIEGIGQAGDEGTERDLAHLVARANELNVSISAEEVRSQHQAQRLNQLGVHAAHGPLLSESTTEAGIDELIQQGAGT